MRREHLLAFLVFAAFLFAPIVNAAEIHSDLTLGQALDELEGQGLTILYSNDLIEPWMRVRTEPASTEPENILREILQPYDLQVQDGPNGTLLIVRKPKSDTAIAGTLIGTVRHTLGAAPISGAVIVLDDTGVEVTSDELGRFRFGELPIGIYRLTVRHESLLFAKKYSIEIEAGETTELAIHVDDVGHPDLGEIVVTASQYQFNRETAPSVSSFSAADLEFVPNVGDDPLRTISRLPGSATQDLTAKSSFRGGAADETLVRFDDLRLYNPFHLKDFQSVFSAIDPSVVRNINVYTGGFPAPYGDRMSGVIDIEPLQTNGELYREIAASFYFMSGLAAGSFDEGAGDWLISARRGNMDLLFDLVDSDLGNPEYFDLYGRFGYAFSDSFAVTGNFLFFDDDIQLFDSDQEQEANASYRDEYYWLRFDYQVSDDLFGHLLVARTELESERKGITELSGVSTGVLQDIRSFSINSIQVDWSWRATDAVLYQIGMDFSDADGHYDYQDQVEFDFLFLTPGAALEPARTRDLSSDPTGNQFGAYANIRLEPIEKLTTEFGLRWDKETLTPGNGDQLSPRVSLLYFLGSATQIRASWGRFFQAQSINELQISDGVTTFFPAQQADHFVVSLEHDFGNSLDFRAEVYRKDYRDLRPRFENFLNTFNLLLELQPDRVEIAPDSAVAEGFELSLGWVDEEPLSWWLSYSWSSVEDEFKRTDDIPRSWDQTHMVSGGLGWRTDKWVFSLAGVYHSGWPTTATELVAVEPFPLAATGPRNAEELDFYMSIDARVARIFDLEKRGSLTLFAELHNALNRTNDCCVEYEFTDDSGEFELERELVDQIQILPSLGFIWRF